MVFRNDPRRLFLATTGQGATTLERTVTSPTRSRSFPASGDLATPGGSRWAVHFGRQRLARMLHKPGGLSRRPTRGARRCRLPRVAVGESRREGQRS